MATTAGGPPEGRGGQRPHSLSPRGLVVTGWLALVVAAAAFAMLASSIGSPTPVGELDARVTAWFQQRRTPGMTVFMLVVTHAHSLAAVGAWSALFALLLARLRERYWILTLALAVGGSMLLNLAFKLAFARARPTADPVVWLTTFSFPSGHTAAATAFYGVLAAFLVSRLHDPSRRLACVLGAAFAVALVAVSRVYLGAHFLSDVVAAACSTTVWLVLCLSAIHALVRRHMAQGRA